LDHLLPFSAGAPSNAVPRVENCVFIEPPRGIADRRGFVWIEFAAYLRVPKPRPAAKRDISCIFLFLAGGSHYETFDPEARAPVEIAACGTRSTNVPGTLICRNCR
jgi:hypothetical protein